MIATWSTKIHQITRGYHCQKTIPLCYNILEMIDFILNVTVSSRQDDIVNFLKIKLGPAVKIYNAIVILKNRGEIPPPPYPASIDSTATRLISHFTAPTSRLIKPFRLCCTCVSFITLWSFKRYRCDTSFCGKLSPLTGFQM